MHISNLRKKRDANKDAFSMHGRKSIQLDYFVQ